MDFSNPGTHCHEQKHGMWHELQKIKQICTWILDILIKIILID